ncbi:peptidoglycan recognition family protein [Paenibacillus sp. FSL R7-0302]|uniref:peptidoglycan recognition protein family protein n=1 Tax=Paenibacillus sp. FSL R7-0302 TaxID=2921681 RepID=UPI0030FB6523
MSFKMKYTIATSYLTSNTKRRSGIKMPGVRFLVAHDTGNPGSTARGNVKFYENSRNELSASAHTFIDDVSIIECIPATTGTPEKAWHVLYNVTTDNALYGDDANDVAIGIELCYGGKINNSEAYKRYVWYIAYLCYKFKLDPAKKIAGHNELDPSRKTDPYKNSLKAMGISKTQFIQDVVKELAACQAVEPVKTTVPANTKEEDDEPMQLAQWQKDIIINGVKQYNKTIINGSAIINSPEVWIDKVNKGTLTAGELSVLNLSILMRTQK